MGKVEKAINNLLLKPNDLKYNELKTILEHLGYEERNKGKTSGSRVGFYNRLTEDLIAFHKPHGSKSISKGAINDIVEHLKMKGVIGNG